MKAIVLAATLIWLTLSPSHAAGVLPGRSAHDLVEEGNKLFAQSDYEGALKKYLEAQALEPNAPELHFNIGDVQFGKGKFDEAGAEFRRVLEKSKDKRLIPALAYNLATAAAKQGQTERAIELYKAAVKLDPKDVEARHNLGVLLAQKEQQKQQQGDKKEDDQKSQPQQQPTSSSQGQQQPTSSAQQQEPDKKEQGQQQPKDPKKDGEQKPESAAPKEPGKDDQKPQGAAPSGGKEIPKGAIAREQAERLLDLLKEEEKKGMFMREPKAKGEEPDPEKDW